MSRPLKHFGASGSGLRGTHYFASSLIGLERVLVGLGVAHRAAVSARCRILRVVLATLRVRGARSILSGEQVR